MADNAPLSTFGRKSTAPGAGEGAATLGRFELRRILRQGNQGVVWLAFDPRLGREVAIELINPDQGVTPELTQRWLQQARKVCTLRHPNIVSAIEADVRDGRPYLVSEYVTDGTLTQWMAARSVVVPRQAVDLMLGVLDALVAAHAAGVVHRSLSPDHVVVDGSGRARVMDFGVGVGLCATVDKVACLAPELDAGMPSTPLSDVFCAAMVFAGLLSGAALTMVQQPLQMLADLDPGVDDVLRTIVLRALAHDPAHRHASAVVFREALTQWTDVSGESKTRGGDSALKFLLKRMRSNSSFPAMSATVVRIQGMATSEVESVGSLADEILKDVSMTNKLLRMANSAYYAREDSIGTVSRAVSLIGFNRVRNMVLSLVLLEGMQDQDQAGLLKIEFLRSLMAASIASELCSVARESEEAFLGAMFQGLGRQLAEYYFAQEAHAVRAMMSAQDASVSETFASKRVLGVSYEDLGIGVARAWGLPEGIRNCMRKPTGEPPNRLPADSAERMRWISGAANEIADTLLHTEPEALEPALDGLYRRFAKVLGASPADIKDVTLVARAKLVDMAQAMELNVEPGSTAIRLLQSDDPNDPEYRSGQFRVARVSPQAQPQQKQSAAQRAQQILAAGVQDIAHTMAGEFKVGDVLNMALETMLRAMEFRHVVFCLRDPKTDALTGRFGVGANVEAVVKCFNIPLASAMPDLFHAVCTKGADTMISDATAFRIANRLPAWYRSCVNAEAFLLLPLIINERPFGLIYADMADKAGLVVAERELALLGTLRDQTALAFTRAH